MILEIGQIEVQIIRALQDNYCYLIRRKGSKQCAVVDPAEARPINEELKRRNLQLSLILNTHHHHDHVGGNSELVDQWQPEVYCSQIDFKRVPCATRGMADGEKFVFEGIEFETLAIPGHTQGQVAFFLPSAGFVFVGDTLFSMGCGRLFEGTAADMLASLNRLIKLPLQTQLFFGHEYTERNGAFARDLEPDNQAINDRLRETREALARGLTPTPPTIESELKVNPFLRPSSLSIRRNLGMLQSSDLDVFTSIRRLRDGFRG
jgi:hydroxyacylglutathione hydrolase